MMCWIGGEAGFDARGAAVSRRQSSCREGKLSWPLDATGERKYEIIETNLQRICSWNER